MENNQNNQHKRRVRYSGTHPKNFSERYKEHDPEKYADTIQKVIAKGSTPAGMHLSIMVEEILEVLDIKSGEVGLDATLGYGGHTKVMLEKLGGKGHIYGLDVDGIEMEKTRARLKSFGFGEDLFTAHNINFADVDKLGFSKKLNFLLADFGVSSMQIDDPSRGFSYKKDGPLDLRLNSQGGISASERINSISQYELQNMLIDNSDEPYAKEISISICRRIKRVGEIKTTKDLKEAVADALAFLPKGQRVEVIKKSSQRTFQALRIDVNNEFEVISQLLEKLPNIMESGGRIAILTFHSGEDRLVKKSFKELYNQGVYKKVAREVIRASKEECALNPRAKSAKLRWAIVS